MTKFVFDPDGTDRCGEHSLYGQLYPAKSVLTVADYLIFDEEALCGQLNRLC